MSDDLQLLNTSLATLGETWGTEIELDNNGRCTLVFDDDFEVLCKHNAQESALQLYASLLDVCSEHRVSLLEYALALNIDTLTKLGASISIDDQRRRLIAYTMMRLEALEPEVLTDQLSQFLSNAKNLQQQLRDEERAIIDDNNEQDQPVVEHDMVRV